MKLLPNINKSVPEAADPALIKPVSDALEALDTALGAAPSTLTTTAKTLVGAINEIDTDANIMRYRGQPAPGTDANTLGTGFYIIVQGTTPETFNYPLGYGILVSFEIPAYYRFQMFADATSPDVYVRTAGVSPNSWSAWKKVTTA